MGPEVFYRFDRDIRSLYAYIYIRIEKKNFWRDVEADV